MHMCELLVCTLLSFRRLPTIMVMVPSSISKAANGRSSPYPTPTLWPSSLSPSWTPWDYTWSRNIQAKFYFKVSWSAVSIPLYYVIWHITKSQRLAYVSFYKGLKEKIKIRNPLPSPGDLCRCPGGKKPEGWRESENWGQNSMESVPWCLVCSKH